MNENEKTVGMLLQTIEATTRRIVAAFATEGKTENQMGLAYGFLQTANQALDQALAHATAKPGNFRV